ncbi:MAG: 4-hydroxy-tetrahydrodipicolinate synthase [Rudaea sp.]|uniref:4-hydroxy-tetrahydrodipicolinate synthase n=1 Tax=unclassified Rudaea TaxID=2627037 RepID=UPI0010FA59E9|nr:MULTISPECIES: 4-hydroxy-tetrahydrodipicolinate synthase [unclassified Rudaea]MBN8886741.1 4-hydroxy-tetrahydrodipicolinate synthase [Rudaea sp.]MBR0344948.1 4-hydroxy-tetrahydrodipicolinate synthase [Rudaea sp.]
MKRIVGSICALATPFRGGALDLDAFSRLIDFQLDGGTQALVVAGSTGEAHALDQAEYDQLLRHAVQRVGGRVPILAGTGTASTRKTIEQTRRAQGLGADAALVVTPYYVRPTQEGLLRHYTEVADHGGLPVMLYNVPGRTGCDLKPETVAKLALHERIVGIKEAVGDGERVAALTALKGPEFSFLSGDDPTGMAAILAGAEGVISVTANVAPRPFRALCDAARTGDRAYAQSLHDELTPLFDALGAESNPIPLKWALARLGISAGELRLPLTPLADAYHERVARALDAATRLAVSIQPRHSSAA